MENQGEIAEALCRGVCRWFGVEYTAPKQKETEEELWQQRYLSLRQSLQALLEENPAQI